MIQVKLLKEVSPLSSKDCFILIERQKSNFNFPIHIHPEYELNYIENAKGAQRIVGDSIEEIEEEELVLVANPQLEHAWMDHNNTSQNIHEITIQFHPDLFSDTFLNKNQMISIRQLFQRAYKGVAFSRETIAKVRPLLKTLSCENDSFYSLIKLIVILHELSVDKGMRSLSTGQFAASKASKEYSNDKLNKITEYLNRHYPEVIRLADMAALVSMSEASFCRMIKQHTSKSFVDFLTDIRVGAASRALIDTSLSIAEIGYDCGFNNLSNFNRIFKKKKGLTPREFRDNYRKNKMII
ncbi:MAG: AraC family transcriptional regulator [Phocaeicola sp.]|uniref:AraC family transcriptional regulator n=1 Tax=Phocaeicola sp. TaxID=2773926 RepID=UPI0023D45067|nr:AraC family transcriptional regulator [Phocaeicola sp.]MDE5676859.1 AraC family transcriptional regulator [Phocaeicola sp.]MDE6180992.1 AraC family transcriptional regulator [Phocaeicola sp.]